MAVRTADPHASASRRAWLVAATLVVLFVAALFLRAYWNLDAAHPSEGEFLLSGGSDPYYHKRAVDAILIDTGEGKFQTLIHDPLLNYPYGSLNPNPPLFQWTAAVGGYFLAPFFDPVTTPSGDVLSSEAVATWWVFLWLPAIFGALTLIPIYFIGRTLFDWRVGVVAALFWTFSTSAIDGTGLGLSDHDAMLLFFAVTAFLFYIKTVEQFRGDGAWIARWRDGSAVSAGLGRLLRERRAGFAYALLAGMGIAAVALVWKGFPYVVGIIFIYAVLQLVIDHWRNRDSTGLFLATTVTLLVGTLVAYPYYAQTGLQDFITPVFYIIAGFVLIGAILVPTRDMPSLLVMPAAAVAGLALIAAAIFVLPNVAQKLLSATVYFKQTTLYTTIAEAHPADFSTIAFGIGPVVFLLALAGWFVLLFRLNASRTMAWVFTIAWIAVTLLSVLLAKWNPLLAGIIFLGASFLWLASMSGTAGPRAHLFALVWAAVALFMAGSAVRFLFNAIPAFALFGAFMLVWVIDWLDFSSIRKHLAGTGGWAGLRKGLRPLHVIAILLIALFLVVPNALLAADAAIPRSAENEIIGDGSGFGASFIRERFGAYGQDFLDPAWQGALAWLDKRDEPIPPPDRPAFLSWWDYGHWAISVGRHPAVADNFQNGYEYAANFLLAQNETHAIQLLSARMFGLFAEPGEEYYASIREDVVPLMVRAGVPEDQAGRNLALLLGCRAGLQDCPVEDIAPYQFAPALGDTETAVEFLQLVEAATCNTPAGCKSIRYVATDIRMMPLDDPQTGSIEQSSIFYAPVTLAGQKGDDYVAVTINVGNEWVTQERFTQLASDPIRLVQATAERLEYKEPFFNSMYYRTFVGTPVPGLQPGGTVLGTQVFGAVNCALPGFGLSHFRVVYSDGGVRLLEFSPGAIVTGRVTEDGQGAANVTVATKVNISDIVGDDERSPQCPAPLVRQGETRTAADGTFRLRVPFGENVQIVAERDDVEIGQRTINVTREQAAAQETIANVDLAVQKGTVDLFLFENADRTGGFDATNDTAVGNVTVELAGVRGTTDADGKVTLQGVPGGRHELTLESDRYEILNGGAIFVVPNEDLPQQNVSLGLKRATLTASLVTPEGNAVEEPLAVVFEPTGATGERASRTTNATGGFTVQLVPGTYNVTVTGYTVEPATLVVEAGEALDQEFVVTRVEA